MKNQKVLELVEEYQHYQAKVKGKRKEIELFKEGMKITQKELMKHGMSIRLPEKNIIVRNGIPYPYTPPETPQDETIEL